MIDALLRQESESLNPRLEPTACRFHQGSMPEHCLAICTGDCFALDIAFYRIGYRPRFG